MDRRGRENGESGRTERAGERREWGDRRERESEESGRTVRARERENGESGRTDRSFSSAKGASKSMISTASLPQQHRLDFYLKFDAPALRSKVAHGFHVTYTIHHVPGKLLYTADTLSRAPADQAPKLVDEIEIYIHEVVMPALPAGPSRLEAYCSAQAKDPVCGDHGILSVWVA